ncbi:MAG: ATP-binding protein [Patescibacteria group bacterium]
MIIEYIKVKNYRQIKENEYTFKKGMNVIFGPNESGKTTLFHVLVSLLFDNPKKMNKVYKDSLRPWGEDIYPYIEARVRVSRIRIENDQGENEVLTIVKDYNKGKILINGEEVESADKIIRYLGITKDLFLKISCIYQNQVSLIGDNASNLQKSIFDIISTRENTNTNIVDIIKDVELRIQDMQKGQLRHANNVGILKKLDDEIKSLKSELLKKTEALVKSEKQTDEITQKNIKAEDIQRKINEIRELIDNTIKAQEIKKSIDSIDSKIKDIELKMTRVTDISKKLSEVKQKFDREKFSKIDKAQNEILSLTKTIEIREQDINSIKNKKEKIDNLKLQPIRRNPIIAVIVSILLVILTVTFSFLGYLILIAVFIDILFIGIYLRFIDYHKLTAFKNPVDSDLSKVSDEYNKAKDRLDNILKEFGVQSAKDLFKERSILSSLNEEYMKLSSTLSGILQDSKAEGGDMENFGVAIEKLERAQAELFVQKKENANLLNDDLKSFLSVDPLVLRRKRIELEDLEMEQAILDDEVIALDTRVSDSEVTKEQIEDLNDAIDLKENEKKFYEKKLKILEVVLSNLKDAKEKSFIDVSSDINELGSSWISKLTDSKYTKISIGSKNNFAVYSKDQQRYINVSENLSAGLIDQIYLLARFSILNSVMKGKDSMLKESIMLLDDPFVTFDYNRLSLIKELLVYLSDFNQIFLFTCHDSFKDLI